jgi:hypothetical protein
MSLLVSLPLGIVFGLGTWAAVRGPGGLFGLILFTLFASVASFAGGLAAEAIDGSSMDAVTAVGAIIGAALACTVQAFAFGKRPFASDSARSMPR